MAGSGGNVVSEPLSADRPSAADILSTDSRREAEFVAALRLFRQIAFTLATRLLGRRPALGQIVRAKPMTEAEWDACADPTPMLEFLRGRASERKLRLLCSADCRRVWHLVESEKLRQAVDALERFADGEMDESSFRAIAVATHPHRVYYDELISGRVRGEIWLPAYGINRVANGKGIMQGQTVLATLRPSIEDVGRALDFFALATSAARNDSSGGERRDARSEAECAAQADLIRELFGGLLLAAPIVKPAWLAWNHGIVNMLAQTAYNERLLPDGTLDTSRLAVLADALEEAGCTVANLLGHLRGAGPHVRGCWVLDAILDRG
jgi:hypothetical protein